MLFAFDRGKRVCREGQWIAYRRESLLEMRSEVFGRIEFQRFRSLDVCAVWIESHSGGGELAHLESCVQSVMATDEQAQREVECRPIQFSGKVECGCHPHTPAHAVCSRSLEVKMLVVRRWYFRLGDGAVRGLKRPFGDDSGGRVRIDRSR